MKKWMIEVMIVLVIVLLIIVFYFTDIFNSCSNCEINNQSNDVDSVIECVADNDCSKAGCSNQICTTKKKSIYIITTCEFKEEYTCYHEWKCICVDNKCNWDDSVNICLEKFKK